MDEQFQLSGLIFQMVFQHNIYRVLDLFSMLKNIIHHNIDVIVIKNSCWKIRHFTFLNQSHLVVLRKFQGILPRNHLKLLNVHNKETSIIYTLYIVYPVYLLLFI